MKLSKALNAFALLLAFVSFASGQDKQPGNGNGDSTAAPQLVIAAPTHDFGEIKAGTPLKWAFTIKNTGKADLLINSVTPG